jgi:hypothetical protein
MTEVTTASSSANASPWIEIFRAGDYRDKGKSLITREDLDRVVRSYDPSYHEAPICIGHPKDNLPAFGWIDRLSLDGDTLLAQEKDVDPKFDEARKAKAYKKRSAAFYLGADGKISGLRHVAYLGAQPPEVKGLRDVNFNDNDQKFIDMDFSEDDVANEKTTAEQIRDAVKDFFAGLMPGGDKTKTFSEAEVRSIAQEAATVAVAPLQAKLTEAETKLATQATQFTEYQQAIAGSGFKARATAAIDKLKAAGKWIPAYEKMSLGPVFEELAKVTSTVEFGEGADKKQVHPLEVLVAFLEGLPKIVPTGRAVAGTGAAATSTINFTEGARTKADPNSVTLAEAAKVRAKEKSISFSEALDQIVAEQPHLAVAGGSAAGAV